MNLPRFIRSTSVVAVVTTAIVLSLTSAASASSALYCPPGLTLDTSSITHNQGVPWTTTYTCKNSDGSISAVNTVSGYH
ncbi:hypothetical protein [Crossiella cryophila]|uniref:Secreted protein n=1 Tax=Crossiella cryophila TaxID=43355 RepID=A0A7W7CCH2_9PSEU|nr:hypothetical protein [Crossiella cryophila]MBB4678642.1 hypothetical protein [Crossiella cryophila]